MSFGDTRTPLRNCGGGPRYATQDEAERSKRARHPDFLAALHCPVCDGWHAAIGKAAVTPVKTAPRGNGAQDSFPAAACVLIDRRDSDDTGAIPRRCCQRCGSGRGNLHRHHRRGKGSGGTAREHAHCPCNAATLCTRCHLWVHAHPEEAGAQGFIVSRSVDEPGSVGVMRFAAAEGGATQWPTCDGEWAETAPEMREVAA